MTAEQNLAYINSYTDHFNLRKYIHFNTKVINIKRNAEDTKWQITYQTENFPTTVRDFDKVVICTGENHEAFVPQVEGRELYKGQVLHSQAFKRSVQQHFTERTKTDLRIDHSTTKIKKF